jgi:hypothetical protein
MVRPTPDAIARRVVEVYRAFASVAVDELKKIRHVRGRDGGIG